MDLIDIFKSFHPQKAEYIYKTSAQRTFSRVGHMIGHQTNINKFKNIEMMSRIISDHNDMKIEINHKKNTKKYTKTWKPNNVIKQLMGQQQDKGRNQNIT